MTGPRPAAGPLPIPAATVAAGDGWRGSGCSETAPAGPGQAVPEFHDTAKT